MRKRLKRLKTLLKKITEESFDQQRGFADYVEEDEKAMEVMNALASESAFYQKTIRTIQEIEESIKHLK